MRSSRNTSRRQRKGGIAALEFLEGRQLLSSVHGATEVHGGPGAAEVVHHHRGQGQGGGDVHKHAIQAMRDVVDNDPNDDNDLNDNDLNDNRGNNNQGNNNQGNNNQGNNNQGNNNQGNNRGTQNAPQEVINNGKVVKTPNFYEVYLQSLAPGVAPRQDLNVTEASAKLQDHGRLVLEGKMNAKIDLTQNSFFVWGIDRNGNLGPSSAPFTNRPNIRFDAVVVVQVSAGGAVSGTVRDLVNPANVTTLPTSAIRVNGDTVKVTVDDAAHALPSTGLPLEQYRFNLWPRVALGASSTVVSFAPEDAMAQVGR